MEQKPRFGRLSSAPAVPPGGRSSREGEGGGAEWRRSTHPNASLDGAVPLRMREVAGGDVPQASGPGAARRPQEGPAVPAAHRGRGFEALGGRRRPRQAAPSPRPQAAGGAGGRVSAGGVRAEGLPLLVERVCAPQGSERPPASSDNVGLCPSALRWHGRPQGCAGRRASRRCQAWGDGVGHVPFEKLVRESLGWPLLFVSLQFRTAWPRTVPAFDLLCRS